MQVLGMRASNDRGGSTLSLVIALAIVGAFVFVGIQLIPIYWNHWNLEDDIKTMVQFAFVNYTRDVEKNLKSETKRLLDDIGADYTEKDLKIKVIPKQKKITVEVWYTRPHKVPFLSNPRSFYIKVQNSPI